MTSPQGGFAGVSNELMQSSVLGGKGNRKKVQRLLRDEGPTVPEKRRKKVAGVSTGTGIEATAAITAADVVETAAEVAENRGAL